MIAEFATVAPSPLALLTLTPPSSPILYTHASPKVWERMLPHSLYNQGLVAISGIVTPDSIDAWGKIQAISYPDKGTAQIELYFLLSRDPDNPEQFTRALINGQERLSFGHTVSPVSFSARGRNFQIGSWQLLFLPKCQSAAKVGDEWQYEQRYQYAEFQRAVRNANQALPYHLRINQDWEHCQPWHQGLNI